MVRVLVPFLMLVCYFTVLLKCFYMPFFGSLSCCYRFRCICLFFVLFGDVVSKYFHGVIDRIPLLKRFATYMYGKVISFTFLYSPSYIKISAEVTVLYKGGRRG